MTRQPLPGVLAGLKLREAAGPASTPLGLVAAAFAGMLAKRLGADVQRGFCGGPATGRDPLAGFAPLLPDGSSALFHFLAAGKPSVSLDAPAEPGTFLLTDDRVLADAWPGEHKVLVRATFADPAREQSELTAMAISGLLDIVGEKGRAPLPLPGYQVAYATGLAALTGLLANVYARADARPVQRTDVAAVEVASWLNWKNRLSSVSGNRQTGLERPEEWRAVRCRDGYIAVIFRDRDMPDIAKLTGSERLLSDDFRKEAARVKNLAEFHDIVARQLAQRGKDDILREAKALNLQISAVLTPEEVFDDNQMQYRQFFAADGALKSPATPLQWRSAA